MNSRGRVKQDMPHPKPVIKAELSEKHFKKRFLLAILIFAAGCALLVYSVANYFSKSEGVAEITALSDVGTNCADDFVFLYDLGADEMAATAENEAVTQIYTDACVDAYEMFCVDQAFSERQNVYSINQKPNEAVTVDAALYEALELVQESGDRKIYLGPVYAYYDDIFFCGDDSQTVDFDPYQNGEIAAYYQEIADFANDPDAVDIELLGDNRVRLHVSDEYLLYAEENGITDFIDFFWMKNAFIVDYLADTLADAGYTNGCITSYDGFVRCLDERDISYSFAIYTRDGNAIDQAAIWEYGGLKAIVYLRNYMMSDQDLAHYYQLGSGEIRTAYLDPSDGLCKSAINDLVTYSDEKSCAEILLEVSPFYIADTWDADGVDGLADDGVYSIFIENGGIMATEQGMEQEREEDGILYLR